MRADLFLICHGPTEAVRSGSFPADDDLEAVATQPRAALVRLRPDDRVWCAPSRAARQTATAFGWAAEVEPALRDCDYGRWGGRALADVAAAEPDALAQWMSDPSSSPHGGESVTDLVRRVGAWLDQCRRSSGRDIALTHAAVIRAAIVHAVEANPVTFWHLDIAPFSHSWLRTDGNRWHLRALTAAGFEGSP